MKKKFRITESELVSLIRNIVEQTAPKDKYKTTFYCPKNLKTAEECYNNSPYKGKGIKKFDPNASLDPVSSSLYQVKQGETWDEIINYFECDGKEILGLNPGIKNTSRLNAGDIIHLAPRYGD